MSINWGKLFAEGRCREIGISWTEEEMIEIFRDKTATVDEVRARYYPEKIAEMQEAIEENNISEVVIEDNDVETIDEVNQIEEEVSNIDKLKQEATDLWIQFAPNIWEKTLEKRIEEFKNNDSNS